MQCCGSGSGRIHFTLIQIRVGKNPGFKKKPAQWVFWVFLGFLGFLVFLGFLGFFAQTTGFLGLFSVSQYF
jgi:hypothetical protein